MEMPNVPDIWMNEIISYKRVHRAMRMNTLHFSNIDESHKYDQQKKQVNMIHTI